MIGERVLEARKRLGLTQKQVAEATKLTQETVCRVERGKIEEPRAGVLVALAQALQVPIEYLATGRAVRETDTLALDSGARDLLRSYHKLSQAKRSLLCEIVKVLARGVVE